MEYAEISDVKGHKTKKIECDKNVFADIRVYARNVMVDIRVLYQAVKHYIWRRVIASFARVLFKRFGYVIIGRVYAQGRAHVRFGVCQREWMKQNR